MAQPDLDHPDEAMSALAESSRIIASLRDNGGYNWLHAEMLYREAEVEINGKTDSACETSTAPDEPSTTPAEKQPKASSDEVYKGDGN